MSDSKKLKKLKQIRRKDLERNLLDVELKVMTITFLSTKEIKLKS